MYMERAFSNCIENIFLESENYYKAVLSRREL